MTKLNSKKWEKNVREEKKFYRVDSRRNKIGSLLRKKEKIMIKNVLPEILVCQINLLKLEIECKTTSLNCSTTVRNTTTWNIFQNNYLVLKSNEFRHYIFCLLTVRINALRAKKCCTLCNCAWLKVFFVLISLKQIW